MIPIVRLSRTKMSSWVGRVGWRNATIVPAYFSSPGTRRRWSARCPAAKCRSLALLTSTYWSSRPSSQRALPLRPGASRAPVMSPSFPRPVESGITVVARSSSTFPTSSNDQWAIMPGNGFSWVVLAVELSRASRITAMVPPATTTSAPTTRPAIRRGDGPAFFLPWRFLRGRSS